MAATQAFKLRETIPGLPGEWVCAGCEQPMTMDEPTGESPAEAAQIEHKDGCAEVRRMVAAG